MQKVQRMKRAPTGMRTVLPELIAKGALSCPGVKI